MRRLNTRAEYIKALNDPKKRVKRTRHNFWLMDVH